MNRKLLKPAIYIFGAVLGIWFSVVASLFILTLGSLKQAAAYAKDKNLDGVVGQLKSAEQSLTYFGWSNLFLDKLPYVKEVYELEKELIVLGNTSVQATEYGGVLLQNMLSGKETELAAWQNLEEWAAEMTEDLNTVEQLLQNDRLEQLAARFASKEYEQALNTLNEAKIAVEAVLPLVDQAPMLLGYEEPQRYALLFQNNMELRPTGGFMGSFGIAEFEKGKLTSFEVQDIYAPDGQIKGYVKEPDPIREYLFGGDHPGWRLRDSNWHPDFPSAAQDIQWFLREGEVGAVDGVIAINLLPVKEMMKVVGPLKVADYEENVTANNFYDKAQYYAENDFFPGSTQKKDFLGAVGNQLLITAETQESVDAGALLPVFLQGLSERQILVALNNKDVQQVFDELNWAGELEWRREPREGIFDDYLHINEANLGINKTNCCVDRAVVDAVSLKEDELKHSLQIEYVNHNPATPEPPKFWGGGYKNYLRVFVPADATLEQITVNGKTVAEEEVDTEYFNGLKSWGTLVMIPGGQSGTVKVEYSRALDWYEIEEYRLEIQKQSGIESLPYSLVVAEDSAFRLVGKDQAGAALLSKEIRKDSVFSFEIAAKGE